MFGDTVVISHKTVKAAKNTICDTSALNLLGPTPAISWKEIKTA